MISLHNRWVLAVLFIGFLSTPTILLLTELTKSDISIIDIACLILSGQYHEGDNIFLLSLYSLIPFLIHSLFCYAYGKVVNPIKLHCFAVTGIISIWACMIPMHVIALLPVYDDVHASAPSAFFLLFIPWFCVMSLGLGLCLAWLLTRHRFLAPRCLLWI